MFLFGRIAAVIIAVVAVVIAVSAGGNRRVDGTYVLQWGTEGSGDGQFQYLYAVAVDGSGNIYVADDGNNRIQKFAPER